MTPPIVDAAPAPAAPMPKASHSGLDVRTIAESALLMDVTVLLALFRVLVPIPGLQGLVRLACPLPFVILALRRGTRAGLVATAASCVLLSTFVGPLLAIQQLVVFGGLGTLFAAASRRRTNVILVILLGAVFYGLGYLLPPFIFGLLVLHIDLGRTLHDVQRQAHSFLDRIGSFRFGSINVGKSVNDALSSVPPGRWLLDGLHSLALAGLTHPLVTLIFFFALYSLINIWAYLIVTIELYRRLPIEARRDVQGNPLDFFSAR